MNSGRSSHWMWTDAVILLERMERLHQQSFAPARAPGGGPNWEPPADMIETDREVLVLVALPGVDPEQTDVHIEDGTLVVQGNRILPPELRTARIHRLELPQGRFERRLALPKGLYEDVRRSSLNGCLVVTLLKANGGGAK
jgi:HSP20 family protein